MSRTKKISLKQPRLRKKDRQKIGASPGLIIVDPDSPPSEIFVLAYDGDELLEQKLEKPDSLIEILNKYKMTWVDIRGLGNSDVIEQIGDIFGIHLLSLEDVVSKLARPKTEEFDNLIFCILRIINHKNYSGSEQLNIFFNKSFVVTFADADHELLEPVRERIRNKSGKIRQLGADYIAYAILDAVIDSYYPVLEEIGEALEFIELEIIDNPDISKMKKLHELKRNLLELRRLFWPLRESINHLSRNETSLLTEYTLVYLRDCYDHMIQLIETTEYYREICSDLINIYLSSVSNRTNDVMKVLTVIATIFIPLTFLAGVYGMNFNTGVSRWNMPELNHPYGYLAFWLVVIVIGLGLLEFFRRKGWFRPVK